MWWVEPGPGSAGANPESDSPGDWVPQLQIQETHTPWLRGRQIPPLQKKAETERLCLIATEGQDP